MIHEPKNRPPIVASERERAYLLIGAVAALWVAVGVIVALVWLYWA